MIGELALLVAIAMLARQAKFDAWAVCCAVIYADMGGYVLPTLLVVTSASVLLFRLVGRTTWHDGGQA